MTLEIRHFVNSFFVITTNEISMALDPWCTSANGGGWHAVPILDINSLVIEVQRCDAIFISHIHNDHFSPDFLSKLDLSSKTIFIKNFRSKALLNQLQALQPKRVIELAPWVPTQFSDIELTVIPQAKTTSGGHEIDYEVDVDTSLLIRHLPSGRIFFNLTDNPLDNYELAQVAQFCKREWGRPIDWTTITLGAASEWPQCFPRLDRQSSRSTFLSNQFDELPARIAAIGAPHIIIAGGRYAIQGKFHVLNQYLAVPDFTEVIDAVSPKLPSDLTLHDLEGGGRILVSAKNEEIIPCLSHPLSPVEAGRMLQDRLYDYQRVSTTSHSELETLFRRAADRLSNQMKGVGLVPEFVAEFYVYGDLRLDENGDITQSIADHRFELFPEVRDKKGHLKIHLDCDALASILRGDVVATALFGGSLAIHERDPDIFHPSTQFALNWLRA